MRSDFYIYCAKFGELSNRALDWFIKSWGFKYGSPEWKICLLKREINMRDAIKCLNEANKNLAIPIKEDENGE